MIFAFIIGKKSQQFEQQMKTPLPYYGGKTHLLKYILPLIPEHEIYVEPFFGGGAVFFAKEPARAEIINDMNENVINFYRVLKEHPESLKRKIKGTLHSRGDYARALEIYRHPEKYKSDPVLRAWALWVVVIEGFSHVIGSWSIDKLGKRVRSTISNRDKLTNEYADRLTNTAIEKNEALKVIQTRDSKDTFFYVDPQYFNAVMGHYGGYTEADFDNLLRVLSKVKGKFLLSCYPSPLLEKIHPQIRMEKTRHRSQRNRSCEKTREERKDENGNARVEL